MIKANELRIGNFLKYKNINDLAIVEIIHKQHFDCRDEYGILTPNGSYKPIPLTEEWLLKFGFKKIKNTPWYREYRINKKNIVSFDKDDKEYSYFNLSSRLCTLKYVHQLQNLYFALTGAELTVA